MLASGRPKILVVGDLMVDLWVKAYPRASNPEGAAMAFEGAPGNRFESLGGAGLVARVLRHIGARTKLLGRLGNDAGGEVAHELLHNDGFGCKRIAFSDDYVTPTKMRFVNDHGIVVFRYDEESAADVYMADYSAHFNFDHYKELASKAHVVVIADYGKGYCQEVGPAMIEAAREYGALTIAAAKPSVLGAYRGADVVKVNESEAAKFLNVEDHQVREIKTLTEMLCAKMESRAAIVTGGHFGTAFAVRNEHDAYAGDLVPAQMSFPAIRNCVGAGDAFLAGLAVGLVREDGVRAPSAAAEHLTTDRLRAACVIGARTSADFLHYLKPFGHPYGPFLAAHEYAVSQSAAAKIVSVDSAKKLADAWRLNFEKIVFTNGCFDLLHRGHVHLLEESRKQGKRLIVGLNTDNSVRALKGQGRPVQDFDTRARLLASMACVDAVVPLDEEDFVNNPALRGMITHIVPNVLVKGAQYSESEIVGWEELAKLPMPGVVWRCPMVDGASTTQTISKINNNGE